MFFFIPARIRLVDNFLRIPVLHRFSKVAKISRRAGRTSEKPLSRHDLAYASAVVFDRSAVCRDEIENDVHGVAVRNEISRDANLCGFQSSVGGSCIIIYRRRTKPRQSVTIAVTVYRLDDIRIQKGIEHNAVCYIFIDERFEKEKKNTEWI